MFRYDDKFNTYTLSNTILYGEPSGKAIPEMNI